MIDTLLVLYETYAGREYFETNMNVDPTLENDIRAMVATSGVTLTCPVTPVEGARFSVIPMGVTVTVAPNGRLLEGATSNVSVTSATEWIYRADTGNWVKMTELTGSTEIPFAGWMDGPLHILVGQHAAPAFEVDLSSRAEAIKEGRGTIMTRIGRPRQRQDA